MNHVEPITEVQEWLRTTLTANANITNIVGNNVSRHPGPRDAAYPILTYFCLTPEDNLLLVGGDIFWTPLRFIVRGIHESGNMDLLQDLGKAIRETLHAKRGASTNAFIDASIEIRPFSLVEMADSIQYDHLGGEYLIRVRAKD